MKKELKEKIENRLKIIYNDSKKEREAAEKLEAMADNLGAKIDRENDLLKGQIESTSKRRKK